MMTKLTGFKSLSLAALVLCAPLAGAQTINLVDSFTGTSATLNWASFDGACLTAGNGSGQIPACTGLPYYSGVTLRGGQTGTLPDTPGNGALRFTNNSNNEFGAVVSNFTFPSGEGLAVTFSTVTYGGTGADGISFFLMDGSRPPGLGALGGSLAYSCSNTNPPYNGLVGGYVALGMDEYGNFLNQGDNTSTGYGFQPGRIGMRGAGNTSWTWLNANYPSQYPSSLSASDQQAAVQQTCSTGYVWNYSNPNNPRQTSTTLSNYAAIPNAYKVLPVTTPISNGSATTRPAATPISYQLRITQNGLLSLSYSYNGGTLQPVLSNQSILASNGPLPATLRFAFAGSTGGSNNIHEVLCFTAGPADLSSSSAGINTQQSGQVKTGTQVYLAYYHTNNWYGELTSQDLLYNATTKSVSISPTANWDASCVLTGGTCATTGATGMTAEPVNNRVILTWSGTAGVPFRWANLTAAQTAALTQGDATPVNANRLNYLRGDRSNEITTSGVGLYRARSSVLGDIIDSSPLWVGPPAAPYPDTWTDRLYPTATMPESAAAYSAFVTANQTRQNVVYVGANDGLLHGFRAGAYDASNNFVNNSTYPNDGLEVLAYMPGATLQTIHSTTATIDYPNPQYAHAFSVDGTPSSGELFYAGAWHTWLVGGLGPGGNAVYALDVTNPANFSDANAASVVKGEWTPGSISCANFTGCGTSMGLTYDSPQIRRFHNGKWGFVFGNGLGSASGKAGIYIVTIDPSSAAQTTYFIDTGRGSTTTPNGIAYTTPADLDGDHVTDYVYAGDVLGNVWRFDLTSNDPNAWAVSKFGNTAGAPLFSTATGQPITTKVMVGIVPAVTGAPRVMVDFGTGQQIPQTVSAPASYASAAQALYGIWDWDMTAWNALAASSQKAALTAPRSIATTSLQTQTVTASTSTPNTNGVTGYRTVSNTKVCWQGSTDCASGNNKFGWFLALPGTQEQVIYSPILSQGAFIVNTTVPANNSPLSCTANPNVGWTMAINPATGAAFQQSFFGDAQGNFVSYLGGSVSGVQLGAVGRPSVVSAAGHPYLVNQTTAGTGHVDQINPPGGTIGSRLTWQQIR